mgnify:CR=1 FL=1
MLLQGYDAWLEQPYDTQGPYPECEDGHHFLCSCGNMILEGCKSRNWCSYCGKFAPRSNQCVCDILASMDGDPNIP